MKFDNRGGVVHAHPTTVIGKSSKLADTLTIDLLHDISASMYTCRFHEIFAKAVGAASCRDCAKRTQIPDNIGALCELTAHAKNFALIK